MAKISEKYEVLYVLNPNLTEEETAAIVEKIKNLIEQNNGTIDELNEWGKRKLAYEINYLTEGYYVLVKFTSGPELPAEVDRILGITDGVIRSLVTLRAE
ncbi:MAG: 30S ribosomal protein S6 [Oscillospiraceae bacterium]|nr:30S ribosomal protein S6 [Oscillospiraceae bacterium]MBR6208235.1 30S ribosomal protein S6 [Oscillospiraceae bacterium]